MRNLGFRKGHHAEETGVYNTTFGALSGICRGIEMLDGCWWCTLNVSHLV